MFHFVKFRITKIIFITQRLKYLPHIKLFFLHIPSVLKKKTKRGKKSEVGSLLGGSLSVLQPQSA